MNFRGSLWFLWMAGAIVTLDASGALYASSPGGLRSTAAFSLFRSTQYARTPSADGGNAFDEVGGSRSYGEASIALAHSLQSGPVMWDGTFSVFARLILMQDLWLRASLPHMTYETCPLALQYTERQYRLGLTPTLPLGDLFTLSSQFSYDLVRGGSDLWRSKESSVSYRAATLEQAFLWRPTLQMNTEAASYFVYLLMAQSIDNMASEFSYQTYAATGSGVSFGASAVVHLTGLRATIQPNLLNYQFVFNDPSDDFTRQGLTVKASQQLWQAWQWQLTVGYWQDRYREPFVSFDECQSIAGGISRASMSRCQRTDLQYLFSPEVYYDYSPHLRGAFSWLMQRRVNSSLPILLQTDHEISFSVEYTPDPAQKGSVPRGETWQADPAVRLHPARE